MGLSVPFKDADGVLRLLNKMQLVNPDFQFARDSQYLTIALKRDLSKTELSSITASSAQMKIIEVNFREASRGPRNLREACSSSVPATILDQLPRSYDIIGDIILVEIRDELRKFSKIIGEAILKLNPRLRLVVRKAEQTKGEFRTRNVEIIAGVGNTETIHHECDCRFKLDVNLVYFNPRLSNEHMRVARESGEGEVVVDMFSGVGPYSILIAKTRPFVKIFAVEWNPVALQYLKENVMVNKVAERVSCNYGDVRSFAPKFSDKADRVIMNLPSSASEYLDSAAILLKPTGGTIHYYTFANRGQKLDAIVSSLEHQLKMSNRKVESIAFQRVIKEVSANRVQIVLDLIVK